MRTEPRNNYNVMRLQQWLDYELSTGMLFFLTYVWGSILLLLIIAAILFTPFMLKVLFEERRCNWITYFLIIVVIPLIVSFLFNSGSTYRVVLQYIPLGTFYFYCFTLRIAIKDW